VPLTYRSKAAVEFRPMNAAQMDTNGRREPPSAEALAKALGGCRAGRAWQARCPAHDDRHPSLSIALSDGKILVRCHAGCSQAEVIAALQRSGLWGRRRRGAAPNRAVNQAHDSKAGERSDRQRTEGALRLYFEATPAAGTLVKDYLRTRAITIPVPDSLRLHPGLRHPSGEVWPAMVALVTRGTDGEPVAIHRTYLSHDGAEKAPVTPQKMMLGRCRGGAVRLGPATHLLMVGEGLETCLAAMQATGLSAWAALSTSGLRSLDLPAEVREVIVLADGDDAGASAAKAAALRWRREGRLVRIATAPAGLDFNDVLKGLVPEGEYDW
jgi:putative DNA primase/helicase